MIGSRLAHYEITNHLGSGGMGDVYQATDSKLRRNVAIKLLSEAFTRDADRVVRFEREARVLASLNDPHIANDLFTKPAAVNGNEELLFDGDAGEIPDDWSPDGRFFLYYLLPLKGAPDVWVLPMMGEKKPFPLANTSFDERMSKFSPDGKWVAYQSNESGGRFEIYVKPFPPRPGQWLVSKGGGSQARWRRDGKELYYIALDEKMMAVPITVKGDTIEAGTPAALFQTRVWGGGTNTFNRQQYDVTADGRFLIDSGADEAIAPITVLLNWKPPAQ